MANLANLSQPGSCRQAAGSCRRSPGGDVGCPACAGMPAPRLIPGRTLRKHDWVFPALTSGRVARGVALTRSREDSQGPGRSPEGPSLRVPKGPSQRVDGETPGSQWMQAALGWSCGHVWPYRARHFFPRPPRGGAKGWARKRLRGGLLEVHHNPMGSFSRW